MLEPTITLNTSATTLVYTGLGLVTAGILGHVFSELASIRANSQGRDYKENPVVVNGSYASILLALPVLALTTCDEVQRASRRQLAEARAQCIAHGSTQKNCIILRERFRDKEYSHPLSLALEECISESWKSRRDPRSNCQDQIARFEKAYSITVKFP